ncbi:MAG: DUF2240 family protein [archaeon]|nr:DUF2240 family protein [archaeon]
MADELEICAAAFFRIKGKDVVTVKEFTMSVSLDFKWLSAKHTEALLKKLLEMKYIVKTGDYLKPGKDFSPIRIPVAYKPSEDLIKILSGTVEKPAPSAGSEKPSQDMFMELMKLAEQNGISKGEYVSESNAIKKKLGVESSVAGLILLNEKGIDISKVKDLVYAQVLKN